ncbi:MAG TPA: hypothetical protein VN455_00965, partial [Methanotrichaceae archaeon]|nr:hypothetical protein [Methanotrichaceae archaeon]
RQHTYCVCIMTYKVWIGASKNGQLVIGAKNLIEVEDSEQVYGIQLPHRVVAKTPEGYRLMTPTDARQAGYQITDMGHVSPFNRGGL